MAGGLGGIGAIIAGTAVVKMVPDFTGFGQKMSGELNGFANRASAVGGSLTKNLTLPIIGVGIAATKAFADAEAVGAQTEAALKSTGGAANVTRGDLEEYAATLSKVTAFEDEAIQSSGNLLLTFTKVRNEVGAGNDVFTQGQRAILDMSQAMGIDLNAATIQIGKALNDPIKGVTALGRAGVQFTAQQKEQIKTLVESGRTLDAQKIILKELETQFGGSAEAFASTGAGKMKQAMNELGNAGESLGAILLPVITAIAGVVTRLATAFESLSPGTQKIVAGFLGVVAAAGPVLLIAAKISTAITTLGPVFGLIGKAAMLLFANPIGLAIAAVIVAAILVIKHWDKVKAALSAIWNAIKTAAGVAFNIVKRAAELGLLGPVALIIARWGQVKAFLLAVWNGIVSGARAAWNTITGVIRGAINAVMGPINALRSAVDWLLPGSPVPFVVGLEASARAMRRFSAETQRLRVPALGTGVATSPAMPAVMPASSGGGAQHYHLSVITRQSLGAVRADYRLMEAIAG